MIQSFRDRATRDIFDRPRVKKLSLELQRTVYRKLLLLDAAETLDDLRVPPGNRLEKLSGDRRGQYSIRVNDQHRICFVWREGNAFEVHLTDYH
ncbi:MAG: type II toxin-antitoxin system RelE/ParE family toxin [bacterium]|nr:type II toxin-antitoxin system RelE/ParE family toxin [bacterium]MDT8365557.1 type II toxin-antitoxin system RelE/ParE family toxin [bacterium]